MYPIGRSTSRIQNLHPTRKINFKGSGVGRRGGACGPTPTYGEWSRSRSSTLRHPVLGYQKYLPHLQIRK